MRYLNIYLESLVVLVSVLVAIYLLDLISYRIELRDEPGGRKKHEHETSVVGGIGITCGILMLAFIEAGLFVSHKFVLAAMVVLMCVGVMDDIRHMWSSLRLIIQIALTCSVFYLGGLQFLSLGDIFGIGDVGLGPLAVVFTCIAVVGGINAVNMMDGLDGLCGGLMAVTFAALALMAQHAGHEEVFRLSLTTFIALTGFLLFNYRFPWNPRARVFMGDSGTYVLGFMVVMIFIMASEGPDAFMAPITALWLMAVPLVDIARVILTRAREGKTPLDPGREHIHYLLVDHGVSTSSTVNLLLGIASLTAAFGMALHYMNVPEVVSFVLFMAFFFAFFAAASNMTAVVSKLKEGPLPLKISVRFQEKAESVN